jgi:hypothetical protein
VCGVGVGLVIKVENEESRMGMEGEEGWWWGGGEGGKGEWNKNHQQLFARILYNRMRQGRGEGRGGGVSRWRGSFRKMRSLQDLLRNSLLLVVTNWRPFRFPGMAVLIGDKSLRGLVIRN